MYPFLEQLREAVQDVFTTMMFMQVEPKPGPWTPVWPPGKVCSAMVGLAGDESGLVYFICGAGFARKVTSSMLGGEDVGEDWTSIVDALGEVANLIGGSLKNKIPQYEGFRLSLPSVIVGESFETHTPGGTSGEEVAFQVGADDFVVRIVFKS